MSDTQSKSSQRDGKYWIKPGVHVAHREVPDRKMIVDDILKKTETVVENGEEKKKTFTVGIECHWWTKDKEYGRGRFLTMELMKWGDKKPKQDPQSFPEEMPSS
jgi:hypothetical protein